MAENPTRWQRIRAWARGLPAQCVQVEDGQIGFTVHPECPECGESHTPHYCFVSEKRLERQWMVRRLEVLQAQYRADSNNHKLGSFRHSEALAFAVSLEYALNLTGETNFPLDDAPRRDPTRNY